MIFRKTEKEYYLSTPNKEEYGFTDWVIFYWCRRFDISYEVCGYFDNRPRINLDLIFFSLTIILPFRNNWTDECDSPKYGISIHNKSFWVYRGGGGNMKGGNKWWAWDLPFITQNWVRTSIYLKDMTWENERPGSKKNFYLQEWKDKQAVWTYNYIDRYDGEVIPTKIYVEEREWRPKWLTWTSMFAKKHRSIDVIFSKEVGKEKGTWKGGVTGCSYEIKSGETPIDCIMRMQQERDI